MTKGELHELVDQLPDDAVEGVSLLLKRVAAHQIDPTQAWVWSEQWQRKLSASIADLQAGRVKTCEIGHADPCHAPSPTSSDP